ncbi:MFS transporter [Granulicella paludicola]|uniref:MFS transporter n=1 Tax=Granulicella paludicola TaxID=474951 RepID=UPI0021E02CFC|nr:MFS transporter [Granulicella paludicola]
MSLYKDLSVAMRQAHQINARHNHLVLFAAILGSGMVFLDGTVVNLAIPSLQSAFRSNFSAVQWVIEAYTLTLASLLLTGGALGDRYGRRRTYVFGAALFALSSIACGLSVNSVELIGARAIQGVGGALLVPGSLALITSAYPEDVRGRAIGTWSAFSAITTAVGPVAGGWLIQHVSWRWIFFLNAPIAVAVWLLCLAMGESHDDAGPRAMNWRGAALTIISMGSLTYALIEWPVDARHRLLVSLAVVGIAALAGLLTLERKTVDPLIPAEVLHSRNFSGANALTFLVYGPLSAMLFFIPLDLIQAQHYSAIVAGAAFSPFVVIMMIFSRSAGKLVERYGARLPLTLGSLIVALGYILFSMLPQDGRYWTSFFPAVLVTSIGMTLVVSPLTTTIMNSAPREHAGIASGINNAVSRLASLLAVAFFSALLLAVFVRRLDQQLALLPIPPGEAAEVLASRFQLAAIKSTDPLVQRAVLASFIHAYKLVLWWMAASLAGAAVIGYLFIDGQEREA